MLHLDGLKFSELTRSLNIEDILDVRKSGFVCVNVLFEKANNANFFFQNTKVNALLLKPFILQNFVFRFEEEILRDAALGLDIARVTRMSRRNPDNPQEFISSITVNLAFHGSELPEHSVFGYAHVPVE